MQNGRGFLTASVSKCTDLLENGCNQVIQEDWDFCPTCGSNLLIFQLETPQVEVQNGVARVAIRLSKQSSGSIEIDLSTADSTINLPTKKYTLSSNQGLTNYLEFAITDPDFVQGSIVLTQKGVRRESGTELFSISKAENKVSNRVARESHTRQLEITRSNVVQARLLASAQMFFGQLTPKPLTLELQGAQSATVTFKQVKGWTIRFKGGNNTLRNSQSLSLEVSCDQTATQELLVIDGELLGRQEKLTTEVILMPQKMPKTVERPRFIIGIDFGTSSTSIVIRDVFTNELQFLSPEGGNVQRFSSSIFIPNKLNSRTWTYGIKADDSAESSTLGNYVQELKKWLWDENDVQLFEGITAVKLLTWYFTRLFQDVIIPRCEAIAGSPFSAFNSFIRVAVPCLDENGLAVYQSRLSQAIESCLPADCYEYEFFLEPESALKGLIEHDPKVVQGLNDGDRVFLVDSGAGTTDTCLGEIKKVDVGWKLNPIEFASVSLPELYRKGQMVSEHFGGGDITRYLGSFAIYYWALDNESSEKNADKERGFELAIKRLQKQLEHDFYFPSRKMSSDAMNFNPLENGYERWCDKTSSFKSFEKAKLDFFKDYESARAVIVEAASLSELKITDEAHGDLRYVTKEFDSEINKLLSRMEAPKRIILVGGNMNLRELVEIDGFQNNAIAARSENLRTAVVYGLVTNDDVKKQFTHDFRISFAYDSESYEIGSLKHGMGGATYQKDTNYRLSSPGNQGEIIVEVRVDESWYVVFRRSYSPTAADIRFRVMLDGNRLKTDAGSIKDTALRNICNIELP